MGRDDDDLPPAAAWDDDGADPDALADELAEDDLEAEGSDDADLPGGEEAPVAPTRSRRSLAPVLLVAGVGIWAAALWLRARDDEPAPVGTAIETQVEAEADAQVEVEAEVDADAELEAAPPQRDDDDDATPEPDALPRVVPGWSAGLEAPSLVTYPIRRGGSMKNVANLFKIFHHEIEGLNPGIDLERELAPGTAVVVYRRKPDVRSESIDFPSAGSLAGAVPMVPGPGRRILAIPWKTWATATTVALLDRVLDQWAQRGPAVQPILVGNLSARDGGKLEPHSTHQSGRDVDLGYPQKLAPGAELGWQSMTSQNLDSAETWALIELLVATGGVEEIYVDHSIQKHLYEWAVEHEPVPKAALPRWLEYPRPAGQAGALIKHVPGHTDHLHVRFACPPEQTRCRSR